MATQLVVEESTDEQIKVLNITRNAINFIEKFERYDFQELLAYKQANWMLSSEDFRYPTDPPMGLISSINPQNSNTCVILIPEEHMQDLDYRELHQIVRELTMGLYILNQAPSLTLEANFDQSTACQLPPAYQDTKIGQMMITVDYMMKALWHGCYFPKDKRTKFSEKWRASLEVNVNGKPETRKNLMNEFMSSGLMDITEDPDYATIYDNIPQQSPDDPAMADEWKFFMTNVESLTMQMTLYQGHVVHYKDMFVMDSHWTLSSVVRILDDTLDYVSYERLHSRLQLQEQVIVENLENKQEIRRHIYLLKFVSYMAPFLIGMKKRMKIPDMDKLLPNVSAFQFRSKTSTIRDECRTERELPPLMLSSDFKCKNFNFGHHHFNLHGGITIDLETDLLTEDAEKYEAVFPGIMKDAQEYHTKILKIENSMLDHYKVPTTIIDGKSYYIMYLEMETFYPTHPQKPLWVKIYNEELNKVKSKKLPMSDIHLHEQFKKYFGYKKAMKCKTPYLGLKEAAKRGLVAMFSSLCRKMSQASRLSKHDEHGLSLLHYAAMNNHPQIITILLIHSMDVNVRRHNSMGTGPTAIHVAAKCGALDAVACLLANFANIMATDQDGWSPIHHAAFYDHFPVVQLMIKKNKGLMELAAKNDQRSTPIHLAASSGGLSVLKGLIDLGAEYRRMDGEGNGIVHLAALRFHTNVLEYLIEWNNANVNVWQIVIGMMKNEDIWKKYCAVKCLEVLSTSKPDHWRSILDADGVPALVNLLKIDIEEIQCITLSVLCNISQHTDVRMALTECKSGPILINLLSYPVDNIQCRVTVILADLACIEGNQDLLAAENGILPFVNLLDSDQEDVLVNAVNAIRMLCYNNTANKTAIAHARGLEPLVEFLTVDSAILQAVAAATIATLATGHKENQNALLLENAAKPLVDLIKGKNIRVQVNAANALEAMATNNCNCQKAFLELDAPKVLIKLLKNVNIEIRQHGSCAIWALAGQTIIQQRYIAEITGVPFIYQMLTEPAEKLLTVGCYTCIAFGRENIDNQNRLANADCFQQLVRLLRKFKTSVNVMLIVVKVFGILCVGVAYRNNLTTQKKIAEEGAIPLLVQQLMNPLSEELQVQVAISLGFIILGNTQNKDLLYQEQDFKFQVLMDILKSKDMEIRLQAGMALTTFSFNNPSQQFNIWKAGGIEYSVFEPFIESHDDFHNCHAAFQSVVLSRVIVDQDRVSLTAQGITILVRKITSQDDNVVVLASTLLASLAHTRAGIPDVMITSGVVEELIAHLPSPNELVRHAVAVALGYLTFNRTAERLLLVACRNTPGIYKRLMDNIGNHSKISPEFIDNFKHAKAMGLPSHCMEIYGGPPIIPFHRALANEHHHHRHPRSSIPRSQKHETDKHKISRSVSAPPQRKMSQNIVACQSNDDSQPSAGNIEPSTT